MCIRDRNRIQTDVSTRTVTRPSAESMWSAPDGVAHHARVARSPAARSNVGRPRAEQAPRARGEPHRCPSLHRTPSWPRAAGARRYAASSSYIRLCHTSMAVANSQWSSIAPPYTLSRLRLPAYSLHLEILALGHQLAVVNRSHQLRLRLTSTDRMLWARLSPP